MDSKLIRSASDVYMGFVLSGLAGVALVLLRDLSTGTASTMGAGYFPRAVSLFLLGIGVLLVLRSFFSREEDVVKLHFGPLFFVSLSLVAFALLLRPAGIIVALIVQVCVAWLGSREGRFVEALVFGIVLAVISAGLFVGLLRVPMKVFP